MIPQNRPELSPTIARPAMAWVLTVEFGNERTVAEVGTPDGGTRRVRLSAGRDSMPSGVFVGPREMLAGERAAVAGRAGPAMYVAEPRRWIGTEKARLGDGSSVPVVQLVATVLRHVAWTAATEQRAGAPLEVVLVRPGDWNPYQVGQLDQAARLAGLGPVRHVVEPPAGSGRPTGSHRVGGARPGRRPRRRVLTLTAAGCVAVLASALVWITVGSSAAPEPGSAPVPVSAPARSAPAGSSAVSTPDPAPGTAGQPSDALPAELAATFPDLDDVARTGTSAALLGCQPAKAVNFGGNAGVALPTYAAMCKARRVPNAVLVFVRYPDLRSGPRNVEADRGRYPSIIKESRWNLNGVDQGPIAGVRWGETSTLPVVLQFGFDRIPVSVAVFAADLDTARAAFTGIRLTPERATG